MTTAEKILLGMQTTLATHKRHALIREIKEDLSFELPACDVDDAFDHLADAYVKKHGLRT